MLRRLAICGAVLVSVLLACPRGRAQVLDLNPTAIGIYTWNTTTNQFDKVPNDSPYEPFGSTPQAFACYGWNASLGQWTPFPDGSGCGGGGGGLTYPPCADGATVVTSNGTAWLPCYPVQGTDSKLLSSGTVSGTGNPLCLDANGGATTSGCTAGSGLTLQQYGVNVPDQALLNADTTTPLADPGFDNCYWQNDSAGHWTCEAQLPDFGQSVVFPEGGGIIVPFTASEVTADNPGLTNDDIPMAVCGFGSGTSGGPSWIGRDNPSYTGGGTCSFGWDTATLPAGVSPSSVTAVYGYAVLNATGIPTHVETQVGFACLTNPGGGSPIWLAASLPGGGLSSFGVQSFLIPLASGGAAASFDFADAACSLTNDSSREQFDPYFGYGQISTGQVGLIVQYSGNPTPPTPGQIITLEPPLNFNPSLNQMSISFPYDAAVSTGAGDVYSVSIPAYLTGQATYLNFWFAPNFTNATTTPSLNLNGNEVALPIILASGAAVAAGDLSSTACNVGPCMAHVILDAQGDYELQNGVVSGGGGGGGGSAITALTGDGGATGPGSAAFTLATVNSSPGSTTCSNITTNGKGLVTSNTNGSCGGSTGLSGMTAGQVPIAATATTVTSSKALAGSGAAITSGPSSSTNGDCVKFTGTAGQIADSGSPCGSGGGGSPGTPVGSPQYNGGSSTFVGALNEQLFQAGVNGAACDDSTDDTSAFNTLLSALYTAGGGTVKIQGTCLISGQVTLPNNGASTNPTQPTIRITGSGASVNGYLGSNFTSPSVLDMRYNATYGKFETLALGLLEIDHVMLQDGGSDCAPFVYTTNTTLAIHDVLFSGTATGTSACNDAIIFGGTTAYTTPLTLSPTAAFSGYGSYARSNYFDKIRRGGYFRQSANAIIFKDNFFSATCGSTSSAAAVELGFGSGGTNQTQNNVFSGNLYETTNYPYTVWLNGAQTSGNHFSGETFWDASGTTLFAFHFTNGATLNVAYVSTDATITYTNLSDDNPIVSPYNAVMDQGWQTGVALAAMSGRLCNNSSGSGTAQSCSTGIPFVPAVGMWIIYRTTTSNSGTGLIEALSPVQRFHGRDLIVLEARWRSDKRPRPRAA